MGVGSTKKEKKEEPKVEAKDLKILLELSQQKCLQFRNKKVNEIKKKKDEIANCLQQNNMELASAKMDNLLKIEDLITVCDILNPIFEIIKEKCVYIISSSECPAELRAPLDTVLYAATRMEVDGLMKFREKIIQKYGIAYVEKAGNNADKFVNQNVVEKLKVTSFTPQMIKIRIKQLCKEKKLNIKLDEDIVGGDWEPQIGDPNLNKNPYASMRPNLPTQSYVQNNSGNGIQGPYPTFGPDTQATSQGGSQNGFPMPNDQGGFPQPSPYSNNQGGFPQPSPYSSNQGGFPQPSTHTSNQGGFPQPSNNGENNNYPSASFLNQNQIQNNNDIWNKTVGDTVPISEKSSHLEQSNPSNNSANNNNNVNPYFSNIPQDGTQSANLTKKVDDLFIQEANDTIYHSTNNPPKPNPNPTTVSNNNSESLNMTAKTMKASLANPDNKENPFINEGDPFNIPTIPENQSKNSKISSQKKDSIKDPFNIPTIPENQSNNSKISSQKKDSIKGPLDIDTVPEEDLKKLNITGQQVNQTNQSTSPLDIKTMPEEDLKNLKVSGQNTGQTNQSVSPLDLPTLQEEDINKLKITAPKQDPFDPNAQIKDPFADPTIKEDETVISTNKNKSIQQSNSSDPNSRINNLFDNPTITLDQGNILKDSGTKYDPLAEATKNPFQFDDATA